MVARQQALLWRRLDGLGHDACRIEQADDGWLIAGAAAFRHGGSPAWVRYQVRCDSGWRTMGCEAEGFAGRPIRFQVARSDGRWRIDGGPEPAFDGIEDVDLGFTPATNLLPIRRLGLAVGAGASVEAIWFDVEDNCFKVLPQEYRRLAENRYRYRSPRHDYEAVLRVDSFGCIVDYPDLWTTEAAT